MKTTNKHINLSLKGFLEIADAYTLPIVSGNLGDIMVSNGSGGVTWEPASSISLTTNDITETAPNLYFTEERVDDRISSLIQDGIGLNWTYDDPADTFTGNVTLTPFSTSDLSEGTNLYFTNERVDDRVSSIIQNNTGISWTYDDLGNTLTPQIILGDFTTDDLPQGTTNLYFTEEAIDDRVGDLIQDGTGLNWTYNDPSNTLTGNVTLTPFSTSDLSEGTNLYYTDEKVDDRVASLIQDSASITWAYNDSLGTLTATSLGSSLDISKNGSNIGSRTEVNFVEGSGITLGVIDNALSNRVDITVSSITANATGTVSKVYNNGIQVGDSDIEILDFSNKLNVIESPDKHILIDIGMLISDLTDVNTTSPLQNDDILRYNSLLGIWENSQIPDISLDGLFDVSISSPIQEGDIIRYNSAVGIWENVEGVNNLTDLDDVILSSPILEGSILMYDSSLGIWESVNGEISSLLDVSSLTPQDLQVLTYNVLSGLWEPFNNLHTISNSGVTVATHFTELNLLNGLTASVNSLDPNVIDISLSTGLISIYNLSDVSITSPLLDGESLVYNASLGIWENSMVTGGPGGSPTIIQVGGATVSTGTPTLDFDHPAFAISESPADTFIIEIDETGLDHNLLTNVELNEHINHTSVTLTAGEGITGGGDISQSRTFDLDFSDLTNTANSVISTDLISIHNGSQEKISFSDFTDSIINQGNLGEKIVTFIGQDKTIEQEDMYLIWGNLEIDTGVTVQNDGRLVIVNGSLLNAGTYSQGIGGSLEIISTNLGYILSEGDITYGQHMFWTKPNGLWVDGESTTSIDSQASNAYVTKEWVKSKITEAGPYKYFGNTTNSTQQELYIGGITGNRLDIDLDSAVGVKGTITAINSSTDDSKFWKVEGLIKNIGGNTSFVGSPTIITVGEDSGASSLDVTLAEDNVNNALTLLVTGHATNTVKWNAKIETTEVFK